MHWIRLLFASFPLLAMAAEADCTPSLGAASASGDEPSGSGRSASRSPGTRSVGTLRLQGLPADAIVESARLRFTTREPRDERPTAVFAGVELPAARYVAWDVPSKWLPVPRTAEWDVTKSIAGDGLYSFTTTSELAATEVTLSVTFQSPSLSECCGPFTLTTRPRWTGTTDVRRPSGVTAARSITDGNIVACLERFRRSYRRGELDLSAHDGDSLPVVGEMETLFELGAARGGLEGALILADLASAHLGGDPAREAASAGVLSKQRPYLVRFHARSALRGVESEETIRGLIDHVVRERRTLRGAKKRVILEALSAPGHESRVERLFADIAPDRNEPIAVRRVALRALAGADSDRSIRTLASAASDSDRRIQGVAVRSLASLAAKRAREGAAIRPEAVSALLRVVESAPSIRIRILALEACESLGERCVPTLIRVWKKHRSGDRESERRFAARIRDLLVAKTSRRAPSAARSDPEAFEAWWNAERDSLPPWSASVEAVPDSTRYAYVPRYDGVPATGASLVFVLDTTIGTSVQGEEKLRRELYRAIDDLPSDRAFNVVVFAGRAVKWRKGLQRASPGAKSDAKRFVRSRELEGSAGLLRGLLLAFGVPGLGARRPDSLGVLPEQIFLFSDGLPSCSEVRSSQEILQVIREINRDGAFEIHTITSSPTAMHLLPDLARENDGTFEILER